MVPTPYEPDGHSGKRTNTTGLQFDCPNCGGRVRRTFGSLTCDGCGYAPRHGAD